MNRQVLDQYNSDLYTYLKSYFGYCVVGFFNSNEILFIGQNPGNPISEEDKKAVVYGMHFEDFKDNERYLAETYKLSIFGKYIDKIIDGDWDGISFTNIVKVPTDNNEKPSAEMADMHWGFTRMQMQYLQPKIVVTFGKYAASFFGMHDLYQIGVANDTIVVTLPHPSYIFRSKTAEQQEVEVVTAKTLINRAKKLTKPGGKNVTLI